MFRFNVLLGLGLASFVCSDLAFGQGWGGSFGGPGGSGFSFSDYLLRKDENHNGVLDPEEWQNSRSRYMIENAAKEAGIDLTRPIPIDRLQAAMTAQREKMGSSGGFGGPSGSWGGSGGWGRPPESNNGSSSPNSSDSHRSDSQRSESRRDEKSKSLPPGVPGFGEKVDLKPVLGFGSALQSTQVASAAPLTKEEERMREKEREREREKERKESRDQSREERRDDRGSSSSGSSSSSRDSARDKEDYERREREKNQQTAKSMVSQYDNNKDGVLAKKDDEWKNLRGTPENADYNKDGIITVDELTERLMERSREQYSSSSRGGSGYGGYGSKPATGTNGKPVRFLTATERLPEGLPSWFTRGDLNGDGQISMGEYATKWDDAKIAEFMKYDINSDGMITAQECIAVEKSRGGSSSSRMASTLGPSTTSDKTGPAAADAKAPEATKPDEKPSE